VDARSCIAGVQDPCTAAAATTAAAAIGLRCPAAMMSQRPCQPARWEVVKMNSFTIGSNANKKERKPLLVTTVLGTRNATQIRLAYVQACSFIEVLQHAGRHARGIALNATCAWS